ncbi:MAG: hypothetical protein ACPHGV_10325, partial [Synechococcus sp.]
QFRAGRRRRTLCNARRFGSEWMVVRLRCRKPWVSALMRGVRKELFPPALRRHLIVVDLPR